MPVVRTPVSAGKVASPTIYSRTSPSVDLFTIQFLKLHNARMIDLEAGNAHFSHLNSARTRPGVNVERSATPDEVYFGQKGEHHSQACTTQAIDFGRPKTVQLNLGRQSMDTSIENIP